METTDFFMLTAATSLGTLIGIGALYCMIQLDKQSPAPWIAIIGAVGYGFFMVMTALTLMV